VFAFSHEKLKLFTMKVTIIRLQAMVVPTDFRTRPEGLQS
jgi:hypothetical protein